MDYLTIQAQLLSQGKDSMIESWVEFTHKYLLVDYQNQNLTYIIPKDRFIDTTSKNIFCISNRISYNKSKDVLTNCHNLSSTDKEEVFLQNFRI
jgi:hypothetical protein